MLWKSHKEYEIMKKKKKKSLACRKENDLIHKIVNTIENISLHIHPHAQNRKIRTRNNGCCWYIAYKYKPDSKQSNFFIVLFDIKNSTKWIKFVNQNWVHCTLIIRLALHSIDDEKYMKANLKRNEFERENYLNAWVGQFERINFGKCWEARFLSLIKTQRKKCFISIYSHLRLEWIYFIYECSGDRLVLFHTIKKVNSYKCLSSKEKRDEHFVWLFNFNRCKRNQNEVARARRQ